MKQLPFILFVIILPFLYGCEKQSEPEYITITPPPVTPPEPVLPQALFSYKTAHPLKAVFTNKSTNAYYYQWDFGDNTTSTLASPTHRYSSVGVYRVRLTAKGAEGTDTYETNVKVEAPSTCYISGFCFNKIPTYNKYYQIQITDDYLFSKTTYLWTVWYLLSSANLPYTCTFNSPKKISTSNKYVLRLYRYSGTGTPSGQESGKGFWTATITSSKLLTYPETVTYSDDKASIQVQFQWK